MRNVILPNERFSATLHCECEKIEHSGASCQISKFERAFFPSSETVVIRSTQYNLSNKLKKKSNKFDMKFALVDIVLNVKFDSRTLVIILWILLSCINGWQI